MRKRSDMKIIFMGTPWFAVPSLEALIKAGHEVAVVVTQPDKPKGRGKRIAPLARVAPLAAVEPSPVKAAAGAAGIATLQPHKIKDAAFIDALKAIAPEAIVVVAYGKILPEAVLRIPPLGCINVHASLLPKYRGAAPVNWAVINGEKETGVTTMLMDRGMDTGAVFLEEKVAIGDEDTAEDLLEKLSSVGARLLIRTLALVSEGKIKARPQMESAATCAPVLKKEDGLIDWGKSGREIKNLIRGVQPWPGAYTRLRNRPVKIYAGRAAPCPDAGAAPGTVIIASMGRIVVKCGQGAFEITELQPENRRRMSAAGFLMGYQLKQGDRFE